MSAIDPGSIEGPLALSKDELQLLRYTCDLTAAEESPLGPLLGIEDDALDAASRSLISRGLIDRATLRPHRDVIRRLLILGQPDARVVLLRSDRGGARREIDCYERAGAFVTHRRVTGGHEIGRPRELEDVMIDVISKLPTRRSAGDFVDFTLTASEYFAFSLLAGDLSNRTRDEGRRPPKKIEVEGSEPTTAKTAALISGPVPMGGLQNEGTPIQQMFGKLSLDEARGRDRWDRALASLEAKDLVIKTGERAQLRPFLRDLAIGLADRHRIVLTRFDFGPRDWIVRDATLVGVPGSLFLVRAVREGAIRIVELDKRGLVDTTRMTLEPLGLDEVMG